MYKKWKCTSGELRHSYIAAYKANIVSGASWLLSLSLLLTCLLFLQVHELYVASFLTGLLSPSSFARPLRALWRWKVWKCVLHWPVSGTAAPPAPAAARARPPSSTSCGTATGAYRCPANTPPLNQMRSHSEGRWKDEAEEEGEPVEEEEEEQGIEVSSPPKPQTCNKPQGLGSIFYSGERSTAMPPQLLVYSCGSPSNIILPHGPPSVFSRSQKLHAEGTQLNLCPTLIILLENPQQSECGLDVKKTHAGQIQ